MADGALEAVAILEKDTNGEVFLSWVYPGLGEDFEAVIRAHAALGQERVAPQFHFSKYKDSWLYLVTQVQEPGTAPLPRVTAYSIALITKSFDPEKYAALVKLLTTLYASTGSPLPLLKSFLEVGSVGETNAGASGTYKDTDFDQKKAWLVTNVKDIIRMFGAEVILLWSALLMKKRVVVYCEKLPILLKFIRALPLLVFHRQNWNFLRPYVVLSQPQEVDDLKSVTCYCAGFTDHAVRTREDLFDVLVDVNSRSITVAEHAKQDFSMGSYHKEIATFLLEATEDANSSDQVLIKNLMNKIKELIARLQKLCAADSTGATYLTPEILQEKKLPLHLQRFLFAVAAAEGLTRDSY